MKISLFFKPYIIKVCFSLIIAIIIVGHPQRADAGFLSNLVTKVLGKETQAAEIPEKNHNSQTVPLLESQSVNPDAKNIKDTQESMTIVEDEALALNTGFTGTDSIDKQYISDAEITTYTVQKGDTLEKIAKKFGVSKKTLIDSNDSLTSKDIVTVGQVLAILPIDGVAYTVKKGDTVTSLAKKYNATTKDILEFNSLENSSDLQVGDTIVIPGGEKPVIAEKPVEKPKTKAKEDTIAITVPDTKVNVDIEPKNDEPKSTSRPSTNGFIWPFPQGVGRLSQGLHDDNAVDIAAPKGTPIYAVKSGKVLIADGSGYNGGYGEYVVINFDDGGQMLFGHMSKVVATAGDHVNQGEIIGYVGSTGKSTGNHTHLSARGISNAFRGLSVGDTSADF